MTGRMRMLVVAALVAAAAVAAAVAHAGIVGGAAPNVDFQTGSAFSTPSGTYVPVASRTFAGGGGVIAVQFSAEGWVQDWKKGGVFSGHNYASLRARVLVNGVSLSPGPTVLFDNSGKIGIKTPRPTSTAFEWAGTAGAGSTTVTVQVRNLNAFDMAQLNRYTLTIQHN